MNNLLEIGSSVDIAPLKAGFDESAAATAAFVDDMNVMFDVAGGRAQRAFAGITEASKEMAANVTASQIGVSQAMLKVSDAQREVRRTLVLLRDSTIESEYSTRLHTAATQQLAQAEAELVAVTQRNVVANEKLAVSSHAVVSGQQAASAAIRSLEGNAGLRAVENFVAKTLGLGPALQAIFPIVGALAFGEILFKMGEEVYETAKKASHAGEMIAEAFGEAHIKAQVVNDDLAIQNDKLGDEIAKLSGKPSNGLALALDEGRKMADKLQESLHADRKELAALLKEHEVGTFGSLLTNVSSTKQQGKEMEADQLKLTETISGINRDYEKELATSKTPDAIKAAGDRKNAAVRDAYDAQILAYRTEEKRLRDEQRQSHGLDDNGNFKRVIDNSAKISDIAGRAQELEDARRREALGESIAENEATVGVLKAKKEGQSERNKADEQRLKADEAALNQMKLSRTLTVREEEQFWADRIGAYTSGSTTYNSIVEKQVKLSEEAVKKFHQGVLKAKAEDRKEDSTGDGIKQFLEGEKAVKKWAEETSTAMFRVGANWDTYFKELTKGEEINAAIAESISLAQLRALEASGGITRLGVAQVEAAMHAREHTAALKALQQELDRLEASATRKFNPLSGTQDVSDPKQAAEIARVKNQIAQQKGKGATQAIGDQSKIKSDMVAPYRQAFQEISAEFNSTVLSILKGQQSIAQGAKKMAAAEVGYAIQSTLQWGQRKLQTYLLDELWHHSALGRKAATEAAANATSITQTTATQAAQTAAIATSTSVQTAAQVAAAGMSQAAVSASDVAKVISYAAVAGAGETAATLDPIAGAALFAEVIGAYVAPAAFEQGTPMVPRTGLAILHQGEAVLASPAAGAMREMMGGGGSKGPREVHLHTGQNSFQSADGDFRAQFAAHESHVQSKIRGWMRDGKL